MGGHREFLVGEHAWGGERRGGEVRGSEGRGTGVT